MKEVLKLRKRRTGQWVTVAGMVLIGACMAIGNTVVFADDTQTYPVEASDSNKFNLTDSPSPLSSENLGTNNRGHEVATLPSTGQVDSSAKTTPEYLMSESSTVSLVTSDVATTETSTSVLASLSEVVPTKSTDSSETLVPSTLSEAPKHASTSEGAVAEVKIQSETLVEHSTSSNNEEESGDNLIYDIHNQAVTIIAIKRKETIKKLIIPQRISNYRVTEIGSRAFNNTEITELYIPDSVTKLGDNSFSTDFLNDFNFLTKVSLPSELQSASSPFYGQKNLKEVVFRGNWKTIPSSLFSGTGIEKLVIPEGVTEIGAGAFSGSSLKEVVLPRTLTKIGDSAFSGTQLTRLTLPEGITEIGFSAFSGSSLKEVVLPRTLTKIGDYAFGRTQLKDITLPTSVTSIGSGAFGAIDSLSSVVIPKNLSNAYGAFWGSQHLKTIHFEEGITKIADGLFQGSGISSINIPETVTEIGSSAFSGTQLTNMSVPSSVREIGSYAFNSTPLEVINLSYGLQIIGSGAFRNTKLETIEIPEGVTYLGDYTLANIPTLKSVYLPNSLTTLVQFEDTSSESVEYHVYMDSIALEYMIEKQLNFKLRDENVANDDSKVLDSNNSYYLTTTTGTRRQGYLGLDLKYAIKKDKSSDDGKYVLHLNIPFTTKVFESKIRVNGQDVTATVSNGYLDIPVSEEVGKIKLMLMTENRELTNVRLLAQLSYQKDRKKVSEIIGAINVNIPVLTLTASKITSRSYSRISGVADPNDQVIAYLDDMVVGQVKIKKDGSYTFDVPLVTPVDNKEYTIKVKAFSSDGREISETTTVRYEKYYSVLENFIMRHNGYTYNLKENQDKVPVINFRFGGEFDFEAEYTGNSGNNSLYLVSNREGINKVIELKWDVKKEKYVYTGYFDQENTNYVPGKMTLYLEKGVAPSETIYSSEVQDNLSQRTAGKILILDSDGDGYPDIVDKHRNSWDLGDRDLAIFSLLSYKTEEEIKKIFLAKSFKDKGLKIGGLDQALFENWRLLGSPVFLPGVANINVYRFVNDKTKEIVLAIRGTDEEVRNGGNMGIEKPYLSPEWIDNYFKIWRGISKDKEVIKKSLNLLLPSGSDYDVSIVGHSRGSYLAYILAAEMLKNRLIAQDSEIIGSVIDPKKLIRGNLKNVVTFNGVGLATWKNQLIDSLINSSLTPLQKILKQLSNDNFKSESEIFELLRTSGLTRAYSIIGDPVSDPFRNGIGIGEHPNLLLPRGVKKHLIHSENGELSEHDIHNFLYYIPQGVRNSKNQFRGIGDLKSIENNERISSTALTF